MAWTTRFIATGALLLPVATGLTLAAPWLLVTGESPLAFMTDKKVAYASLFFESKTGAFDTIEISGEFPYARYLSFMVYGSSRSQPYAVLADVAIEPDEGSVNPFRPHGDRAAPNRRYKIYAVKEESGIDPSAYDNVMVIPEGESYINILMRVYRPDVGRNVVGGVPLPGVRVLSGGPPARRPDYGLRTDFRTLVEMGLKVDYKEAASFAALNDEEVIEFYRLTWDGGLPNAHVPYLNAALGSPGRGADCKLAVLNFRAPTYESSYPGGGSFTGDKDLRYYSFCSADIKAGQGPLRGADTYECLADDELKLDADGTTTLVVYPRCLKEKAEQSGLNRLRRGTGENATLIFRQMLPAPGFHGDGRRVPALPFPLPEDIVLDDYKASSHIGAYAPTGRYYTGEEFDAWLASRGVGITSGTGAPR